VALQLNKGQAKEMNSSRGETSDNNNVALILNSIIINTKRLYIAIFLKLNKYAPKKSLISARK
jgi:hypothetical protein